MERKYNDRQDTISQYTFNDYPKELQKKITLLQHFKNYLEGDFKQLVNSNILGLVRVWRLKKSAYGLFKKMDENQTRHSI